MRALFHFGLFALALAAVSPASADDHRRQDRRTTVVVAPVTHRAPVRRVSVPAYPAPSRYDWERARREEQRRQIAARRALYEQQRDHDEIVRIRNRWQEATYQGNPVAQRNAERRAHEWIDREIAESRHSYDRGHYVNRLHALRRELRVSHAWPPSRGRGHGFRAYARKVEIFDELVMLSAREVHRALAEVRGGTHQVFARR